MPDNLPALRCSDSRRGFGVSVGPILSKARSLGNIGLRVQDAIVENQKGEEDGKLNGNLDNVVA